MAFNPFNQTNQKKKTQPVVNHENFIEALKSIGGGVVKGVAKDVGVGVAQNAFDTIMGGPQQHSGDLQPGGSLEFDQLQQESQEKLKAAEHLRQHQLQQKEEMIFSAKEEQTKREIVQVQVEIQKLAKEVGEVAHEAQVASMQQAEKPGEYHVSFFEHLKNLLQALRKKLADSASWLSTVNDRASRKKGYWSQFAKKGSSFSMHEERKMSTQAG
ncbi:MAG: hypothetical protein HYS86_04840 [Candidatus Chisholmbacteria bacterium]|nr:hypothetical protein [Candidatus Chisholmbacteria bacterium]